MSTLHRRIAGGLTGTLIGVFAGLLFLVVLLGGLASPAAGHAFAPALLELREVSAQEVLVRFKQPAVRAAGSSLRPVLPETCRATGDPRAIEEGTGLVMSWPLACDGGLVGQTVAVSGIAASQADVLLRVELADGRSARQILTPARPSFVVPEKESALAVGASYGRLGIEHILGGFDHLLFVFGLLLLVGGGRRLVGLVTAFTLGHSVTLALASLGLVHLPQAPVEVLIAFSIYVLAVELTRPAEKRWSTRGAFAVAAGFGLLHGLGFAGALSEAGLPQHDVPAALFAFNLGIELGQLAFLAVAVAGVWLVRRLATAINDEAAGLWLARARVVPVYAIGVLAAFWTIERAVSTWSLYLG